MLKRQLPLEEFVSPAEFTNRVAELAYFEEWFRNIGLGKFKSMALIAPRRLGKTAVLERLVNIVFFKDYGVAPIYFSMRRENTTLRKVLLAFATAFHRQYIAYLLKDPTLYNKPMCSLEELLLMDQNDERIGFIQKESIAPFLKKYNDEATDPSFLWDEMIKIPEFLAKNLGVNVGIIIDEFQELKDRVFNVQNEEEIDSSRSPTDLTATFQRQALSRQAPMLVSGSAVTMTFKTVMGGALGGRFGFTYLKPMSIDDGAELAKKLLGEAITHKLALYLSYQLGGHPFYITCCAQSDCPGKDFSIRQSVDKVIDYEVTRGDINGFWKAHFDENKDLINQDDDTELGKKIIYYFTKYNNQPVEIAEIAEKLNVSKEKVEAKIEKLYQADLVYYSNFRYYAFCDYMLMRFIHHTYQADLDKVDEIDVKARGFDNYLKGKLLEMIVQNLFHAFGGEELPGELFGRRGKIVVPKLSNIGSHKLKLPSSPEYEIDVFGEAGSDDEKTIWVAECKYRSEKAVSAEEVEKLLLAAKDLERIHNAARSIPWLVSTCGFTANAKKLMRDSGCLFSTDKEINTLAKKYGIGVTLK